MTPFDSISHNVDMFLISILAFISLTLMASSTIYAMLIYFNNSMPRDGVRFFVFKYAGKNVGLTFAISAGFAYLPPNLYWLIIFFPMIADLMVNIPILISVSLRKKYLKEIVGELEKQYGPIKG